MISFIKVILYNITRSYLAAKQKTLELLKNPGVEAGTVRKKRNVDNTEIRSLGKRNVWWFRKFYTDDGKKYLKRFSADPSDVSNQQRSEDDTVNIGRNPLL